jgi:hypothetical protein
MPHFSFNLFFKILFQNKVYNKLVSKKLAMLKNLDNNEETKNKKKYKYSEKIQLKMTSSFH